MSLTEHARRELELSGQYAEDPAYSESVIRAVEAFVSYGHSGGSAFVAIEQLHRLLQFKPLSPLTSDPADWIDQSQASGTPMWQNRRDPAVFSKDGGQTWYSVAGEQDLISGVYRERDQLVAALSLLFPSHLSWHEGDDWDDDWRNIVCIHLPTGQATWHIHASEVSWFGHLPRKRGDWDGHTTEEKYQRLQALAGHPELKP